jgi:hypothetical protein
MTDTHASRASTWVTLAVVALLSSFLGAQGVIAVQHHAAEAVQLSKEDK